MPKAQVTLWTCCHLLVVQKTQLLKLVVVGFQEVIRVVCVCVQLVNTDSNVVLFPSLGTHYMEAICLLPGACGLLRVYKKDCRVG